MTNHSDLVGIWVVELKGRYYNVVRLPVETNDGLMIVPSMVEPRDGGVFGDRDEYKVVFQQLINGEGNWQRGIVMPARNGQPAWRDGKLPSPEAIRAMKKVFLIWFHKLAKVYEDTGDDIARGNRAACHLCANFASWILGEWQGNPTEQDQEEFERRFVQEAGKYDPLRN